MCCHSQPNPMTRREFIELAAAGAAGAGSMLSKPFFHSPSGEWDPSRPPATDAIPFKVQPILIYSLSRRQEQTSWRSWGGIQTEEAVSGEAERIQRELRVLSGKAGFPVEILPVIRVRTSEEANRARDKAGYDVSILYAASGWTDLLEGCMAEGRNVVFLRHRSGPVYLWYEILHNRFLRVGGNAFELDGFRYPAGMTVDDVVVDDLDELSAKLLALYAVRRFLGHRIVALGGSDGWCCPQSPRVAAEKFKMDIRETGYTDLAGRIRSLRADPAIVKQAEERAQRYLAMTGTSLQTEKRFVVNAFLLYRVFREMMDEHHSRAFTIRECMGTVMPISETTACLPLSLINDEGDMAFCESDFNVIPAGILLRYISGTPVFLNDPTFPHHGMVTVAHCTAPRRMDGKNYARAQVMTHFESDYGATPKVELPIGTEITMVCPDSGQSEWLGFTGKVEANPFYDICRSQYDIGIHGDWKKLLRDHRGFHWMMTVGNHMKELEHACSKIGVRWNAVV